MLDIGWTEVVTIVILAVLVIGPKDLPKAMRTVARMIGKIKAMMREFQGNIDEMIKETELEEVKKQISSARTMDLNAKMQETIDPKREMDKALDFSEEAADFNKSMKESSSPVSGSDDVQAVESDTTAEKNPPEKKS
jgi:sec-independent protein translocase protein TatB